MTIRLLFQDVARSFNDILDYYRINGIDYDKNESDEGIDVEDADFFMV